MRAIGSGHALCSVLCALCSVLSALCSLLCSLSLLSALCSLSALFLLPLSPGCSVLLHRYHAAQGSRCRDHQEFSNTTTNESDPTAAERQNEHLNIFPRVEEFHDFCSCQRRDVNKRLSADGPVKEGREGQNPEDDHQRCHRGLREQHCKSIPLSSPTLALFWHWLASVGAG